MGKNRGNRKPYVGTCVSIFTPSQAHPMWLSAGPTCRLFNHVTVSFSLLTVPLSRSSSLSLSLSLPYRSPPSVPLNVQTDRNKNHDEITSPYRLWATEIILRIPRTNPRTKAATSCTFYPPRSRRLCFQHRSSFFLCKS